MMETIDLSQYKLTFQDEFDALNISSQPSSTATWYTRTPWNGDFGSASFAGSDTNGTFSLDNGALSIEANRLDNGKWTSGLIASVDPNGEGFSQQYGYFEMRAQLPAGQGLWPSFWMIGMNRLEAGSTYTAEVDVLEHYGVMPNSFTSKVHVWQRDGSGGHDWDYQRNYVPTGDLYVGFHTYGVDIQADFTTFYFDGKAQWTTETPEEHRQPMIILADLGLGGGWPIDQAPDGAKMKIDYIRVYAESAGGNASLELPAIASGPEAVAPDIRFAELFDTANRIAHLDGIVQTGAAAALRFVGGIRNDRITGGDGADRLAGHKGDDVIHGGGSNDQLYGDQNNDTLYGDAGNDELYGGGGHDVLDGGDGNDFLNGGGGIDLLTGGDGADRYVVRARDKGGEMLTDADAPGIGFAQWVEIHGFDIAEGDRLALEGFPDLAAAIGRDNIVSTQAEFDALAMMLRTDGDVRTNADFDLDHDSLVLTLVDTVGVLHVVEFYNSDFLG